MLLAVGAGTLGAAALVAGPVGAAGATTTCGNNLGQPLCPPTATFSKAAPPTVGGDEEVTVTWTPAPGGLSIEPGSTSLTMAWAPPTTVPAGAPQPPLGPVSATGSCVASGSNLVCTYDWPSGLANEGYVLNGTYSLSATATDCRIAVIGICSKPTSVANTASVANPPMAPTNVKATLGSDPSSGVSISWTPSPEPDLVGYEVLRNNGSTACTLLNYPTPSAYRCTDTTSGGGDFSYHVVAVRYGATYAAEQELTLSSPATSSVTVPGPPATSTTVVPGGGTTPLTQPGFTAKPTPIKVKTSGGTGGGAFAAAPKPPPAAVTPTTSGGSFSPVLPYGQQQAPPSSGDPQALGVPKPAGKSATPIGTIGAIGAGLLIAVIALHGLWLRGEVRRADALEALDPEV